jgi:predicted Fe-Mo cluster-binding NifX family protein
MGARALDLFAQNDIKVFVGASALTPEELVKQYLDNTLQTGGNVCDH